MTAFPAAMAQATRGKAVQIGQFQADMTKTTPRGYCCNDEQAIPKPMINNKSLYLKEQKQIVVWPMNSYWK